MYIYACFFIYLFQIYSVYVYTYAYVHILVIRRTDKSHVPVRPCLLTVFQQTQRRLADFYWDVYVDSQ